MINKLHSKLRSELEEMCKTAIQTKDVPLGEKAMGLFIQALDRSDLGQLLKDQLEDAVGKDCYPALLSLVYDDVYVRFIDILKNNAEKYIEKA